MRTYRHAGAYAGTHPRQRHTHTPNPTATHVVEHGVVHILAENLILSQQLGRVDVILLVTGGLHTQAHVRGLLTGHFKIVQLDPEFLRVGWHLDGGVLCHTQMTRCEHDCMHLGTNMTGL